MKYVALFILIVIIYFILRRLFFKTKITNVITHKEITNRRLKELSQRQKRNEALENNIVFDIKSKTGFDLSKAILKVYIDYSTGQLSSEEAFFVADDITQFIEQAKTLNCAVNEIRITCCKLDTISRLIKKATRNNRPAKLNASNLNLIRTFEKLERGAKVMQGYCLFGKGGREDFQGDVTVTILPELSLIAVDQFHY